MIQVKSKIIQSAFIVTIGIIISKSLGFIREVSIARAFGASKVSDSYFMAMLIPTVLFYAVANAITTTFIPIFTRVIRMEGENKAFYVANNVINAIIICTILVSSIEFIFSEQITGFIAKGFMGKQLELTIQLTKIMIPITIFLSVASIFTAILQAFQKFFIPAIVWVPHNLVLIIYTLTLSEKWGIIGLAMATIIASSTQVAIQLPQVFKVGYRYQFTIDLRDKWMKKMIKLVIPVLIGIGIIQINTFIDRMLASDLEQGSISALNYANKLFSLPLGVLVTGIVTVIFPKWSKLAGQKNVCEIKKTMDKALKVVILLIIPVTILLILFKDQLIKFLFERGSFTEQDTKLTSIALLFYSIGMFGVGMREVLNRVYYALQDTKTTMINGGIAVFINIILNLILVRYLGHGGLALATSISSIIAAYLLLYSLSKSMSNISIIKINVFIFKIIGISCIMGYSVFKILNTVQMYTSIVGMLIGTLLGIVIYLILLKIFKIWDLI